MSCEPGVLREAQKGGRSLIPTPKGVSDDSPDHGPVGGRLILLRAPDTPIGRYLHRMLVVVPALRLDRVSRGQWLLLVATLFIAGMAMWFGGGDGARMTGMVLPDMTAWMASVEITTYLGIIVATVAGWTAVRAKGLGRLFGSRPSQHRLGHRAGRRALHPRRPDRPAAANDEEHGRRRFDRAA